MAEGVLFNIAEGLTNKLLSLAAQEAALWCGLNDQLRKLQGTVTRIKAVLHDAEEQAHKQNHQVRNWLGKLREAVLDAEDLLDDFSTEHLRKQLMPGSGIRKEIPQKTRAQTWTKPEPFQLKNLVRHEGEMQERERKEKEEA